MTTVDLRPRRATSQIGKSRRNGEATMRVVRNRASQAPRSRWLFVFTEIYPRVAPIWVSALPWMEELSMELSFTGLAKKGQNGLSWKMVRARGSSSWESGGTAAEASAPAVARSAAAYSEAERQQRRPKAAPGSAPALLLNFPPAAASDKSATAAPHYGTTTTASSAARAGNIFAVARSPAATLPRRHLRHYSVWCDSPASCHTPSLLGVLQRTPGSSILNFQSNPGL